jgi:hypothetical protein
MSNLKIAELSWKKYIYYYNDLRDLDEKKAKMHYILHGKKENRLVYQFNFDYFKGNGKPNNGILFSCNDYPGFGGAATNCYQIIKEFQRNNLKCCGLFFNNLDNLNNPYQKESILYSNIISNFSENIATGLRNKIINILGGEPKYVICKTYKSILICRLFFPKSYFIYLISGITHFHLLPQLKNISFQDFLKKEIHLGTIGLEKDALKHTNLIIFNSDITKQAFFKIYPNVDIKYQISDTSLIEGKKDILPKIYDIVICCSDLKRIDKNNQFVLEILQKNFTNYRKIIIGKNYQDYQDIPNSTFTDLISHTECKHYISQSKILIYPSLFDSNPNTVREALSYQCLPLISNNVGYYNYYPEYLVCKNYNRQTWITKIKYLLDNYQQLKEVKIKFPETESLLDIITEKMMVYTLDSK